jgi:hypothetical protein
MRQVEPPALRLPGKEHRIPNTRQGWPASPSSTPLDSGRTGLHAVVARNRTNRSASAQCFFGMRRLDQGVAPIARCARTIGAFFLSAHARQAGIRGNPALCALDGHLAICNVWVCCRRLAGSVWHLNCSRLLTISLVPRRESCVVGSVPSRWMGDPGLPLLCRAGIMRSPGG